MAPTRLAEVFSTTAADYRAIRAAYIAADYDARYPMGGDWVENLKLLVPLITDDSDPLAKLHRVHETVMYTIASSAPETQSRMVDWYLAYLRNRGLNLDRLDPGLEESTYANPDNTLVREDRRLSSDFLRTLILVLEIEAHCALSSDRTRVLELGAGYGGVARTFKLRHPNTTYVIVDIPETLFFASTFLRLSFPAARVLAARAPGDLRQPLDEFDFVFVPTMFAEELNGQTFTLFCNTASMGEMTNAVVHHWMDFVQRQVRVRYFFGLNRFLNTVGAGPASARRLDENCASVSFDSSWRILHWEVDPPFARCPYLETLVSRNLEVVAEREPPADAAICERRSQELAESVAGQDWFTHPVVRAQRVTVDGAGQWPLHGTRASVQLTPDLGMSGTLFALWESIRLHPSPTNVRMMLRYLETLTGRSAFEEIFYYEDLLARLSGMPVTSSWPRPAARPGLTPAHVVRHLVPAGLRSPLKRLMGRIYYGETAR
jgi:putative sugar O-methyltransferase